MKRTITIFFILLSLLLLLLSSCVKEQETETTAAGSTAEEVPVGSDTSSPVESTIEPDETQNNNPFVSDNEAEYKDSWK